MTARVWHGLAVLVATWLTTAIYTRGMVAGAAASGIDITISWWMLMAFNTIVVVVSAFMLLTDRRD